MTTDTLRISLGILGGLVLLAVYLYGRWRGQAGESDVFRNPATNGASEPDVLLTLDKKTRQDPDVRDKLAGLKKVGSDDLYSKLGSEPNGPVKVGVKPSDLPGALKSTLADQPAVRGSVDKNGQPLESADMPDEASRFDVAEKLGSSAAADAALEATGGAAEEFVPPEVSAAETQIEDKDVEMALENALDEDEEKQVQKAEEEAGADVGDDVVVVMHIVAPKGQPFSGRAVLKAFHANALRFGDMNIFHRVSKRDGQLLTVFSVANMLKPGTLNPRDVVDGDMQGLSLFTRLPNKAGNIVAFDEMLHCAQHIASTLRGELRDQKLRPMTHGSIMIQRGNLRKRFPGQA